MRYCQCDEPWRADYRHLSSRPCYAIEATVLIPPLQEAHPAIVARAWHDISCPEGPECRDRLLHSAAQTLAYTGILARFLGRLAELHAEDAL